MGVSGHGNAPLAIDPCPHRGRPDSLSLGIQLPHCTKEEIIRSLSVCSLRGFDEQRGQVEQPEIVHAANSTLDGLRTDALALPGVVAASIHSEVCLCAEDWLEQSHAMTEARRRGFPNSKGLLPLVDEVPVVSERRRECQYSIGAPVRECFAEEKQLIGGDSFACESSEDIDSALLELLVLLECGYDANVVF